MITYAPRDDHRAIQARRLRLAAEHSAKKKRTIFLASLGLLITFLLLGYFAYLRPVVTSSPTVQIPTIKTKAANISWPAESQSALALPEGAVLAASPQQSAVPTASVAKVVTALVVLQKHPLKSGEAGPSITITQADVDSFSAYASKDGSTIPVELDEKISEYQALQAIMLPSANNIADSLAVWAYGSMENYHRAANTYVKTLGMNNTTIADDASGFSAATTSTARDLTLLGQAAFKHPVLREIAQQKTATLPVVGEVQNVNKLLGEGDFVGIKTGNTAEAGGCYLFASKQIIEGHQITLIGAITKASSLEQAFTDSKELTNQALAKFTNRVILAKNTQVGIYKLPWGEERRIITSKDLTTFGWIDSPPKIAVEAPKLTTQQSWNGKVTATSATATQSAPLHLDNSVIKIPLTWKLKHPFLR